MVSAQQSARNGGTRPGPPTWWTDPNGWLPGYSPTSAGFGSERRHSSFACAAASKPTLYRQAAPHRQTGFAAWIAFQWPVPHIEYQPDKSGYGSTWEFRPEERNCSSKIYKTSRSPLPVPGSRPPTRGRSQSNRCCRPYESCQSTDTARPRHSANCRPDSSGAGSTPLPDVQDQRMWNLRNDSTSGSAWPHLANLN